MKNIEMSCKSSSIIELFLLFAPKTFWEFNVYKVKNKRRTVFSKKLSKTTVYGAFQQGKWSSNTVNAAQMTLRVVENTGMPKVLLYVKKHPPFILTKARSQIFFLDKSIFLMSTF